MAGQNQDMGSRGEPWPGEGPNRKFPLTFCDNFRYLEEYEAWIRIGNQNSLVKTYPPPEPEKIKIQKADTIPEMTTSENAAINFLRDCWFSC